MNLHTKTTSPPFLDEKSRLLPVAFIVSVCIHLILFLIIAYLIKANPTKTIEGGVEEPTSVHVTLNPPQAPEVPETRPIPSQPQPKTLTQERKKTKKPTFVAPPAPPPAPEPTQQAESTKNQGLSRFMPNANPEFMQRLRNQASEEPPNPKDITGDAGDIPIRGRERRRDIPQVVERFEHKDLSLFQFSVMFHERFGAAWNAEERWLPKDSPLRPGDVIYYKIYIKPDGSLDHFENLTAKIRPNLKMDHLDKIFAKVLEQALPMPLPGKLEKDTIVTEVLAIQVVDKTLFMNFGGG